MPRSRVFRPVQIALLPNALLPPNRINIADELRDFCGRSAKIPNLSILDRCSDL